MTSPQSWYPKPFDQMTDAARQEWTVARMHREDARWAGKAVEVVCPPCAATRHPECVRPCHCAGDRHGR